jgi:hypothetical protein
MDNNKERTDRFFRERLANFELMPDEHVWENIASRLESVRRKRMVYLFVRIAAGMTLLVSLGLGYYLVNRHAERPVQALKNIPAHQPAAAAHTKSAGYSGTASAAPASAALASAPQSGHPVPTPYQAATAGNSGSNNKAPADLALLSNKQAGIFQVPMPDGLGYRRLSEEEMQEQEASLMAGFDETAGDDKYTGTSDRWALGSEIAPLYSYRTISSDYLNNSSIQALNKSEQGLVAYAGGLRVAYAAGRRLSVQSGLYYSRYGQQKDNIETYSANNMTATTKLNLSYISIPNSTGTIYSNSSSQAGYDMVVSNATGTPSGPIFYSGFPAINASNLSGAQTSGVSVTQYFDYLELPVTVKYKIINRKLGFSILGGVITNFLVNNGIQLKQHGDSESFGKTRDINKVNYQGSVGLGIDYPLMENVSFSLEPRFRYYLNSFDKSSVIDVHPYSFGLFAGVSIILK